MSRVKVIKTEQEKVQGYSPIRAQKIIDGRSKIDRVSALSMNRKMLALFEECYNIADGYSSKEIALIFWPNETEVKDGITEPNETARKRTVKLLNQFRTWIGNENLRIYCDMDKEGRWIYYAVPTKMFWHDIKRRLMKSIDGAQKQIDETERVLKIPLSIRKRNADKKLQLALQDQKLWELKHLRPKRKNSEGGVY